jgi:hypothetical protein
MSQFAVSKEQQAMTSKVAAIKMRSPECGTKTVINEAD